MAVNAIVKYGDAVLRQKATAVAEVDDAIRTLVDDMLASMYAENGVGLAAEQIGRTEAVCVIDVPVDQACGVKMPLVLINPEITAAEGEQVGQEGCLSFPDVYINVRRAERVEATYLDPEGNKQTVEATGLLSRAIQHETDHLNGVLLVDHMSPVQKVANAGKLKRLKRGVQRGY
jgi:peptide deformylase